MGGTWACWWQEEAGDTDRGPNSEVPGGAEQTAPSACGGASREAGSSIVAGGMEARWVQRQKAVKGCEQRSQLLFEGRGDAGRGGASGFYTAAVDFWGC